MLQQPDVVKFHTLFHLLNTFHFSRRPNFPEMMGGKPHQNVWPWVKPKPMEARFLQFVLCMQVSPPYRRAGGNRIAFHTKGLLQKNREGRKPRLGTHSRSLTEAQESQSRHIGRAVKQCIFSELGSTMESDGSPQQRLSWDIWKTRYDKMKTANSAAVRGKILRKKS